MNSFEIIGQARLAAAEGQRMIAIAALQWLRNAAVKLVDAVGRHLPEGKTAPWYAALLPVVLPRATAHVTGEDTGDARVDHWGGRHDRPQADGQA